MIDFLVLYTVYAIFQPYMLKDRALGAFLSKSAWFELLYN